MALPRFRLRTLMIAVAVAACLLAGLLAFAARPYPVMTSGFDGFAVTLWSDGITTAASRDEPYPILFHDYRLVRRVDWSDGFTSWYPGRWLTWLQRPIRKPLSGR